MKPIDTNSSVFLLYYHKVKFGEWMVRSRGPLGKMAWVFLLVSSYKSKRRYWDAVKRENAQGYLFGGAA